LKLSQTDLSYTYFTIIAGQFLRNEELAYDVVTYANGLFNYNSGSGAETLYISGFITGRSTDCGKTVPMISSFDLS